MARPENRKEGRDQGRKHLIWIALVCLSLITLVLQLSYWRRVNNKHDEANRLLGLLSSLSSSSSACQKRTDSDASSRTNLLSYEQSFGFFDDIKDSHWRRQQERAHKHKNHKPRANPLRGWPGISPALWYLNNYDPLFTCPHMVRIGGPGDGPKWTCDPHRLKEIEGRKCIIYSVGCAGKFEWEDGLVEEIGPHVCEIHVFDPSKDFTRPGDAEKKNIHFHKWGLHSSYDSSMKPWEKKGMTFYTLKETMEQLKHVGQTVDIFKIDCEFCEWFTFRDWISPDVDIRQLLIESHNLPGPVGAKVFFPFETTLKPTDFFDEIQQAGFAMFSREPNIHPVAKGNGVEWGYVKLHKDFWNMPVVATSEKFGSDVSSDVRRMYR